MMKRSFDSERDQGCLKDQKKLKILDDSEIQLRKFEFRSNSRFEGKFPYFREPKEIGSFSQNYEKTFQDDRSQLRFYRPPENLNDCHFDLTQGCDSWIRRDENVKDYLNDLCRWLLQHKKSFSLPVDTDPGNCHIPPRCLNTDFICWRGLITKLLCTPYENREGWKIAVTLFNETYYMCEFDTEARIQQKEKETEYQKVLTFGGYKFEQYVTAEGKDGQPDTSSPVNNNEAFCSVVRTRLNKHSLVFGGEVDCCTNSGEKMEYIELKTSREIETSRQDQNFKRFKLIKWWAQSFLVGIGKIVCGFRDDSSIVHRLQTFPTVEIPKQCRDIYNAWNPNVCFNFCDAFLQHIKDTVKLNDPRVAFVFEWRPKEDISCVQHPPGSKYAFLQPWYYCPEQNQ